MRIKSNIEIKLPDYRLKIGAVFILLLHCTFFSVAQAKFKDITEEAGINHQFMVHEGLYGGGACAFDYNNDGFEDLYITGGVNTDAFYHNNGNGTFKNVFLNSGLEETDKYVTQGVVSADINRDGWVDLFITTIKIKDSAQVIPRAMNLLFLNNGDSTFRNATIEFGLEDLYSFSTGANFGDFNSDGYPDLYVGNYFLEYEGKLGKITDATIVNAKSKAKGYLLLNKKGKYFEEVYSEYGLDHRGFGWGGLFTDFDNDGDQDLIVNHDFGYKSTPNLLYRNEYPSKSFSEVGKIYGMDLKINAMGVAVGDYDENGWLDYFVTDIHFSKFMVSQGSDKPFLDKLKESGMAMVNICWGANFADFDHDGDLDLFVANGDLNPNCVPMANFYFENNDGQFTDKARSYGLNDYGIGRGSVTFDMENDGDLDILVVNQKAVQDYPDSSITRLFRNDISSGNWLKIGLAGKKSEAHGIGSRVEVVSGGRKWIREIDGGGSSHLSQNSTKAHFGLGSLAMVDSVIVRWTGGEQQIFTNQPVNQLMLIVQEENQPTSPFVLVSMGVVILILTLFLFYTFRKSK